MPSLYLDNNATTPVHPEVLDAMLPWLSDQHHNPSSGYRNGKKARQAIDHARQQVASLINAASPEEIIFTGCGTESNNAALKYLARHIGRKSGHVLTSAIEHSAVLRPIQAMTDVGFTATHLPVTPDGRLDLDALKESLKSITEKNESGFLSLMWANNETGITQPIHDATLLAKEHGLPIHSDAIQAVGKIPVNVQATPLDYLSISGHKFHAPKGIGALYLKQGTRFEPLLRGGGQEFGHRSGTENVAFIVALGHAAELMKSKMEKGSHQKIAAIRDHFEELLIAKLDGHTTITRNGDPDHRAFNISHLSFSNCEAAGLLLLLDQYGLECSAGSACMTGKQQASHVQTAMGLSNDHAKSSLRLSFSILSKEEDAQQAADLVAKAVKKLKSVLGLSNTFPAYFLASATPICVVLLAVPLYENNINSPHLSF